MWWVRLVVWSGTCFFFRKNVCLGSTLHAVLQKINRLWLQKAPVTVVLKWNATDKIWDFSTTDFVIWMNQSIVPKYSLGWFLWGGLQGIKYAWFSLEGFYLWICQFSAFSIIFFMEFEVGHLKEPFFLSRIVFCLIKKCGHIHEL